MSADELMLSFHKTLPLSTSEIKERIAKGGYPEGEFLINVWIDGDIYEEFLYTYENAKYDELACEAYNAFLADWTKQVIGDIAYERVEWFCSVDKICCILI